MNCFLFIFAIICFFVTEGVLAKNCDAFFKIKSSQELEFLKKGSDFSIYHIKNYQKETFDLKSSEYFLKKVNSFYEQINLSIDLYNQIFDVENFKGDRYRDIAELIFIFKDDAKYNGQAFSKTYSVGDEAKCKLLVILKTDINKHNLTPAHEMFHIYHFSNTKVNRPWLNEGLARWAMHPFRKKFSCDHKLPLSKKEMEKIFHESYSAVKFWNRLACVLGSNSDIRVNWLGEIKDIKGGEFVRTLFLNLQEQELFFDNQYFDGWREDKRLLDKLIVVSIKNSISEFYQESSELDSFLRLLEEY